VAAELLTGTYGDRSKATWAALVGEYEQLRYPHLSPNTRRLTRNALKHFARVVGLKKAAALDGAAVARYSAARLTEPGKGGVGTVRPAIVNLELRHLKAVFAFAAEHGYVTATPKVRMLKEPKRLPRVVAPDRFAELFAACDAATLPAGVPNVAAPDWWRALFTHLFMTGGGSGRR
jgi:site-specific recombinase XerD